MKSKWDLTEVVECSTSAQADEGHDHCGWSCTWPLWHLFYWQSKASTFEQEGARERLRQWKLYRLMSWGQFNRHPTRALVMLSVSLTLFFAMPWSTKWRARTRFWRSWNSSWQMWANLRRGCEMVLWNSSLEGLVMLADRTEFSQNSQRPTLPKRMGLIQESGALSLERSHAWWRLQECLSSFGPTLWQHRFTRRTVVSTLLVTAARFPTI